MITRRAGVLLGTAVVSVAGVAKVFAPVYIVKNGLWKLSEAFTCGVSEMAQLRRYASADLDS
jgi:hypothetical protein